MKKIISLIILLIMNVIPALADTMPFYMNSIPQGVYGLYQTDKTLVLRTAPREDSPVIKDYELSYIQETMPDNMFAVLLNEKQLGFLYVVDIDDDGWVKVIYDKQTKAEGWVKTTDRLQFLPWINFYNLYGRKYGLRILKDAPEEIRELYSKAEELSQPLSKLNYVKQIKLTAIRGNWALVSVYDLDKIPKMGYLRWRGNNGEIYAFPNIK